MIPPRRALIVLPCCIGDVVLATGVLRALRRAYPAAILHWAVGSWSRPALEDHPDLNETLDTGPAALPMRGLGGVHRMARLMRREQRNRRYNLVISLVRSPWMSIATLLAQVEMSVGLDSGGRGFGYRLRVPVDPAVPRHEWDIYLETVRAIGLPTQDCYPTIPAQPQHIAEMNRLLALRGLTGPYIVVNPAGGMNPGMRMTSKRYPPASMARVATAVADHLGAQIVLLGGPDDAEVINETRALIGRGGLTFAGALSFPQMAALAHGARLYLGNDTGLTHLAAATNAPTVMIMGPSDPRRYRPVNPHSTAIYRPYAWPERGVAAGARPFDWAQDGIPPHEAIDRIIGFVEQSAPQ